MQKRVEPRVFKGARDFPPEEMVHRERIIDMIKSVFRKFGFAPLETPAIEYLEVLSGKYGDEADRLIYRLNYKPDTRDEAALRYDLTVPLSRFIAMNPNLIRPFRRYQIQPVWRADRPQPRQGRFREFYQCDVDTIGTPSVAADAELVALTQEILSALGFPNFTIRVNDRKLLASVIAFVGVSTDRAGEVLRSLDKLDKMSFDEVAAELKSKSVSDSQISKLKEIVDLDGEWGGLLDELSTLMKGVGGAGDAIGETRRFLDFVDGFGVSRQAVKLDLSLARGLDYYTGPIFETILPDHPHIGSLTGGGRYDTLIGMFSGVETPATGTSIGLDRIFSAMKQLKMIDEPSAVARVFVTVFADETRKKSIEIATALRSAGISCEVAMDSDRLKKQFNYADKKDIPLVIVVGDEEIARGEVTVKNLKSGEQVSVNERQLTDYIKTATR